MRFVIALALTLLIQAVVARGQDAEPRFDVTSVKANRSGDVAGGIQVTPGRFDAANVTVRILIRDLYEVRDHQIVGGPTWALGGWNTADHFDIQATVPVDTTPAAVMGMMRALLRDRFQLKVHFESRQMPVYVLVAPSGVATRLVPANGEQCVSRPEPGPLSHPRVPVDSRQAGRTAPAGGERAPCGVLGFGHGSITGRSVSIEQLATALAARETGDIDRPVVDQTAMTGLFDIDLKWTALNTAGGDGPTLFTAVQEQLGLRLLPQQAPMEVLVIDHIERPTGN